MVRFIYFFLMVLCFAACKSEIKPTLTGQDTSAIVTSVIDDKRLYHDMLKKSDTIYIVKSKNINKSWPFKTEKFKLVYIERTKKNEDLIDLSPPSFYDQRTRIDFGKIILNKEVVDISFSLYQFQEFSVYDCQLKQENKGWAIVKMAKRAY